MNKGASGGVARSGEESMPWMLWVADLGECVNHGALLVRLECNVDIDSGSGGWVAQSLPSVGTVCQVCLACMSSQCTIGVTITTRGTEMGTKSAESQKCRMRIGGEPRMCGLEARDPERHQNAKYRLGCKAFMVHFLF